jgi:hypothetical protein
MEGRGAAVTDDERDDAKVGRRSPAVALPEKAFPCPDRSVFYAGSRMRTYEVPLPSSGVNKGRCVRTRRRPWMTLTPQLEAVHRVLVRRLFVLDALHSPQGLECDALTSTVPNPATSSAFKQSGSPDIIVALE